MKKNSLTLFAKIPDINTVKTRLAGYMSDDERLKLYISLLNNTIVKLIDLPGVDTYICYSPQNGDSYFSKYGLKMFPQSGGDLGIRMYHAFEYIFSKGYQKAVLIGVDIPEISEDIVTNAFCLLSNEDIVFGPALDGGYYLIGMKKPIRIVFQDIEWSTDKTLRQSIAIAESHGYTVACTNTLSDLDTPEDVKRTGIHFLP